MVNTISTLFLIGSNYPQALLFIPKMGRRKFSMRGKPYGRNELISEYIWLSYVQSLGPGEVPDESMRRIRKQVSSHIQVLKGFMKDHPASKCPTTFTNLRLHVVGHRLFSKTAPANGFEDSFKHDPCLIALQENRVWTPYSDDPPRHGNRTTSQHQASIKPAVFWLLITEPKPKVPDVGSGYMGEENQYRDGALVHKYAGLSLHPQRERESLETIPNWRERFPYMARMSSLNELNCEIIHMDVSLDLMRDVAPSGAELVTRMEIAVPGPAYGKHRWQAVTSLFKPQDLYYHEMIHDPPLDRKKFIAEVLNVNATHTRIKIPFPANTWAHALSNLTHLQHVYEDGRKAKLLEENSSCDSTRRARDYIDQISMYQEVQSAARCSECMQGDMNGGSRASRCTCGGRGYNFETRAIILWTFSKARRGEGSTTWRHIDLNIPPRRVIMSPSPHPNHHIAASMNEHFSSWAETPMHLHPQNMTDHFAQGLATPPNTAGLQSPFVSGFGYTPNNFDVSHENISFLSHANTVDIESTMIEENTPTIDSFLSNTAVNIGDFDHDSHAWNDMPQTDSFVDADSAWTYNVPTSTAQMGWENDGKSHAWPGSETTPSKNNVWPENTSPTKTAVWHESARQAVQLPWIEDGQGQGKDEHAHEQLWNDVLPIPVSEQKMGSWIEAQGAEGGGEKSLAVFNEEGNVSQIPGLGNGEMRGWDE